MVRTSKTRAKTPKGRGGDRKSKVTVTLDRAKTAPSAALADLNLDQDPLLPTAQAAVAVGLTPKTLRAMRADRTGPRCLKFGNTKQGRVAYRKSDLEAWVRSRVAAIHGS
jgi:hypothetical protein